MNTLAMDLSSHRGSLALFRDDELLGTAQWEQNRRDGQALFREWPALLNHYEIRPVEIGCYICGRGPGTFSGLRVSLSAARAAAIPGRARVYAISSGEALAREHLATREADSVAVIGDARRDRLWCGLFTRDQTSDPVWSLVEADRLPKLAAKAGIWASPQYDRLQDLLPEPVRTHEAWVRRNCLPTAEHLGRAALDRIREDRPGESLTPLYLHPPVAGTGARA